MNNDLAFLDNIGDIIDAATGGFAENINSNVTADQARANALAASVTIAQAKAMAEQKRKDKLLSLFETALYVLLAGGMLSVIILFYLRAKK